MLACVRASVRVYTYAHVCICSHVCMCVCVHTHDRAHTCQTACCCNSPPPSGFDIILNGLDNLEARRHVNRLAMAAEVPLVESGTAGYLGQACGWHAQTRTRAHTHTLTHTHTHTHTYTSTSTHAYKHLHTTHTLSLLKAGLLIGAAFWARHAQWFLTKSP